MRKLSAVLLCSFFSISLIAQNASNGSYKEDFNYFWSTIRDNYCYWDKKHLQWEKVRTIYAPLIDTVNSRESFIGILERAFNELYDHHSSLNTNTPRSQRLVPSGADIWAEYINGKATIAEVKQGSGAERVGLRKGMLVLSYNDVPVDQAIRNFLPKCLNQPDAEAKNFALRVLLAGNHTDNRKIVAEYQNEKVAYYPDSPVNLLETRDEKPPIVSKLLKNNVGYILINNSLGDNDLIPLFDSALTKLRNTAAMILDLRNTPSGGNTSVARAILGRFISKEGFYQKHELTSEEKETGIKRSWIEIVSPRKPIYQHALAILVDHWTGSVGEGIAIGFDALKRGVLVGTRMAALNGAVYSFTMPNTKIGFSFPAEKLFHVNGTPREDFKPSIEVDLSKKTGDEDMILQQALNYLSAGNARQQK